MEKKGRSESKSDVTCVEAAAEAEDGGINGDGGAAAVAATLLLRPRTAALKAARR